MPSYPPVQSVVRAFRILRELNQRSIVTIDHLHKTTRLPKPTIVRLLETLIGEGLVTTDKRLGGYCVTSSVKGLSTGYHNASLLVEAGRAHCATFTKAHKWPLSIAVPEDNALVIRFNTIADSPAIAAVRQSQSDARSALDRPRPGLSGLLFGEGTRGIAACERIKQKQQAGRWRQGLRQIIAREAAGLWRA